MNHKKRGSVPVPEQHRTYEEELHVRQALAVTKLDGRDLMGEQGIDGQGTPAITTVEAAHDLGQHSEGLEEPSKFVFEDRASFFLFLDKLYCFCLAAEEKLALRPKMHLENVEGEGS